MAKNLDANLSPASVRNVMADLEDSGLLYAPHTSAGRLPTEAGLRLFVDGLLELGDMTGKSSRTSRPNAPPPGPAWRAFSRKPQPPFPACPTAPVW